VYCINYNCRLIRISVKGIMSVDNNRLRKDIHRKSTAYLFAFLTILTDWIAHFASKPYSGSIVEE